MSHPIEALLRPPVELYTGISTLCCALAAFAGPEYLMMTPSVGYGTAVVLTLFGLWWLAQGIHIVRYQRNIAKLSTFEIAPDKIPDKSGMQYLGRGFPWTEKHTQRLHDTRRTRFQPFVNTKKEGTALHGVELKERELFLPLADRRGHTLILGTTGVGKTRALEILVSQDIRRGGPLVVFDPKGDADLLTAIYQTCKDNNREFMMFHLGYPEISARYNGVGQFSRITEVASRIAGQLSGDGQSAVFREFAWRFVNIVAKAVVSLGDKPDYKTIFKHVTAIDDLFVQYVEQHFADDEAMQERFQNEVVDMENLPRHLVGRTEQLVKWEKVLSDNSDEIIEGLRSAFKYERSYFDKIVASLLPLLEKLTTGNVAELLSPDYLAMDDNRPIFDWRSVVNHNKVVYVGLDALSDAAVASAVGNSMFADLVSYAGARYKYGDTQGGRESVGADQKPIPLYMDEFNELMGDEFIPMINKGGAAGLHVTALTQTYSDVQAKIGVEAKAKQVRGNFNTLMMLRVMETETAELLTDQLPRVNVNELTLVSGYNDSSDPESEVDFTSRHEDRLTTTQVSMLEPHDVMKLPKGQAFAMLDGGKLHKVRFPLAKVTRHKDFNQSFSNITRDMRKRYRSSGSWWVN